MSVHAETAIEIWDEEKLIALLLFLLSFLFSVSEEEEEEEEEEGERGVKVMEPVTFGSRSSSSSSRFIVSLRVTSLFLVLLFRVLEFFFSQRRNSMNYFFHFLANRAEMLVVSFK
jgi:hypothetical protein|tara:strand:+ start:3104 stop:3448 length:345 start_codon:yes stop_codon:yes gene_type:complete